MKIKLIIGFLLLGLMIGTYFGASAIGRLTYNVTVNVIPQSLEIVGPNSFTLDIEQGGSGQFIVQLQNTTLSPVVFQFFGENVPNGIILSAPGGQIALAAGLTQFYTVQVFVGAAVPIGGYGFTLLVDDPLVEPGP